MPAGLSLFGSCHPRSLINFLSVCSLSTMSLHACRALAVLLGLYSLAVVVAEATITPALPNMSVFSQTLRRVAHNTIACEMLCFLFLIYPCCAAYFAIYKLGRWSFYLLVPRCITAAGGFGLVVWRAWCFGALPTCTWVPVHSKQLVLRCCVSAAGWSSCVLVSLCLLAKGGAGAATCWFPGSVLLLLDIVAVLLLLSGMCLLQAWTASSVNT